MKFILNGTAEIALQPGRFKILQSLKKSGPSFVEQIARDTGIHPRLVSHHLDVLEQQKLVECNYEIANIAGSKRGVAVRSCRVTNKAEEVFRDVRESAR